MTEYELENPYTLLYRHSKTPYKPDGSWCVDGEFEIEKLKQVGASVEIRTPDSVVRSEVL